MSAAKNRIYKVIAKLPENKFTQPIIDQAGEKIESKITAAKQDLQRKNWDLVQLHALLKTLIADENTPEENRKILEKTDQEIVDLIETNQLSYSEER